MGLMKVGLLLFLMAFISTTVAARFDANTFPAQMMADNGEPNYFVKSTTTACCDKCFCTRSMPPQCHCNDIGETCHSACEACLCTRSFPPQCRCPDITNFCYPPCSAAAKSEPAN